MFKKLSDDYKEKTSLWWLSEIKLADAYAAMSELKEKRSDDEIQSDPPLVAVMDSGVDYEHEGLKDAIWTNPAVGQAGCINDLYGCNTINYKKGSLGNGDIYPATLKGPSESCDSDESKRKQCVHGTHVSGLIAGSPDVNAGVAGICPWCKLMTLRIVADTGGIPDLAILNALKYISLSKRNNKNVVRIINCSFGKLTRSRSVTLLVKILAEKGLGTMLIGAAGNEQTMKRSYPAAAADAIAVAALNDKKRKSSFSNFGAWVDISAPGGDSNGPALESFAPGGDTFSTGGTSQASPIVAAVAALVLTAQPDITIGQLRSRLLKTADPIIYDADEVGIVQREAYYPKISGEMSRRTLLGTGLVDAAAAIKNEIQAVPENKNLDRVQEGCATLNNKDFRADLMSLVMLFLSLGFPIFLSFCKGRQKTLSAMQMPCLKNCFIPPGMVQRMNFCKRSSKKTS